MCLWTACVADREQCSSYWTRKMIWSRRMKCAHPSVNYLAIFRSHRMRSTDAACCYMLLCGLYVYPCVCNTDISCNTGWTDRYAVWHVARVGPCNHILDGGLDSPRWRGNFGGRHTWHARSVYSTRRCCLFRSLVSLICQLICHFSQTADYAITAAYLAV